MLTAFAKTSVLAPAAEETLELSFDLADCAAFDTASASKILEKGEYILRLGNASDHTVPAAEITLPKDVTVWQGRNLCGPQVVFDELHGEKFIHTAGEDVPHLVISPDAFETVCPDYAEPQPVDDADVTAILKKLRRNDLIELCVGAGILGMFAGNTKLRQAIAYAINKEDVLLGAMEDVGEIAHSVIPSNCFGAPENPTDYEYDVEKAKALLAEAGYPDGFTIKMPTMSSGNYIRISDILVDQLRQVGITVEQELMERTAYLQDVYTNCQYEMTVLSVSALQPDADFITYMRYHSAYIGGGNNFTKVSNPRIDELLEIGRFDNDPAARAAAGIPVISPAAPRAAT